MKKRSNPIPLISVAVLCLMLIGYMNMRNAPTTPDEAKPAAPAITGSPQATGPEHAAPSKAELSANVNVGSTSTPAGGPPGGPPPGVPGPIPKPNATGGPMGRPGGPPPGASMKPPKPKPSDSAISGQWYIEETNKNGAK